MGDGLVFEVVQNLPKKAGFKIIRLHVFRYEISRPEGTTCMSKLVLHNTAEGLPS